MATAVSAPPLWLKDVRWKQWHVYAEPWHWGNAYRVLCGMSYTPVDSIQESYHVVLSMRCEQCDHAAHDQPFYVRNARYRLPAG